MSSSPRILMVVTSNNRLAHTDRPSGLWVEELAEPYRRFEQAGIDITIASPKGGRPPFDDMSLVGDYRTSVVDEFLSDPEVETRLQATSTLAQAREQEFDAVFVVGGFGVMWDLVGDQNLNEILSRTAAAGQPIAAVCHAPAALASVRLQDGQGLIDGIRVTGFSNDEENAVALGVDYVATVEDALRGAGGLYEKSDQIFGPYVVTDGLVLTGQNPASSGALADALVHQVLGAGVR